MLPYRVYAEIDPVNRPQEMVLVGLYATEAEATLVATAGAASSPSAYTVEKADGGQAAVLDVVP